MDGNIVREREKAVQAVKDCGDEAQLGGRLWHAVSLWEGITFYTSKKLPFTYRIKGRELFCDRKEKSITEATVLRAYKKILEARAAGEPIRGPKKLSMFGAPYIWGILKGLGLAGGEEAEPIADGGSVEPAAETAGDAGNVEPAAETAGDAGNVEPVAAPAVDTAAGSSVHVNIMTPEAAGTALDADRTDSDAAGTASGI